VPAGPAQSAAARRALPIFIVLLAVLMFLPPKRLGWVGWFGDLATVVIAPISHPASRFAHWIDPPRDHRPNDESVEQLRQDRDAALYQMQSAQEQIRELERIIRELQGGAPFSLRRRITPLYAPVIGGSSDLSSRNLIVKRGSKHGVVRHTVAVVRAVQIVGMVTEVSPKTCTVRPITDRAAGRIEGRIIFDDDGNGLACSLSPTGKGTLRGDVGAVVGDRAIDPSEITVGMTVRLDDDAWPQNAQMLVLGAVELIEDDPDKGLRKIVTVRPTIEIERVKEVTLQLVDDEEDG